LRHEGAVEGQYLVAGYNSAEFAFMGLVISAFDEDVHPSVFVTV